MVADDYPKLGVARQCELLGLAGSSFYYQPSALDGEELTLLRLIDQKYLKTLFYSSRRMAVVLHQHLAISNSQSLEIP